mgnify:FL=1
MWPQLIPKHRRAETASHIIGGSMSPATSVRALTVILAGLLAVDPVGLRPASADPIPADRAGLDSYIRDYLMSNPEVVRDALLKLEQDEQVANTKRVLLEHKDAIYAAGSPEIGNPDAKVTIVEFSDYNCPYCRATYPELKSFLKENPDTKMVLKNVASFGKDSEAVARIVIAASKQGNFEALHDALMTQKGQVTEERALDVAKGLGFDIDRIKANAAAAETAETLAATQKLADQLSVNVTPLYVIGHHGVAGAPDDLAAQLNAHAESVRKNGCEVC